MENIKLLPINRKPCKWWRVAKVLEDEDAKGIIGAGINIKKMKKLVDACKVFLITIALLLITNLVFAEIPIYCPKCKLQIYTYDGIIEKSSPLPIAEKFKPSVKEAKVMESGNLWSELKCPFDDSNLNGWEYWIKKQHFKSYTMAYPAVSLLSKDKDGKWIWIGDNMPMLNFNEETK